MSRHLRIALLTFGAGLPNWRAAAQRLARQGQRSGWFREVAAISDKDLFRRYPDFCQRHRSLLRSGTRGFGYWIWKPFLIGQLLKDVGSRVDFVLYLDAGFELNFSEVADQRMRYYVDLAESQYGRMAMFLPGHPEQRWSKRDTMSRLGLSHLDVASDQIQATPLFRVSSSNIEFCEEWLQHCESDDYHFLDDSPSIQPNASDFVEHRHDQSIFSGLAKRRGIELIPDETFWAPTWAGKALDYPLWAVRNRTRVSICRRDFRSRAIRLSEKSYSRLWMELRARHAKSRA